MASAAARTADKAEGAQPARAFPLKACQRLAGLFMARKAAKSRLDSLIKNRKALDSELDELGAGDTPEHLRKSRMQIVTLRAIIAERAAIQNLADKSESTVEDALQGKFEYDDIEREDFQPPKEADLFKPKPKEEDDEQKEFGEDEDDEEGAPPQDSRPVGRLGPKLALAGTAETKEDRPYYRFPLANLSTVADRAIAKLKQNGITMVWDVLHPPEASAGASLVDLTGITPGDERDIRAAIVSLEEAWRPKKIEAPAAPAVSTSALKPGGLKPGEQVDGDGVITKGKDKLAAKKSTAAKPAKAAAKPKKGGK